MNGKLKKEIIEWLKAFIFAIVIAGLLMIFARPSFIVGKSMMPTFEEGNLVLVEKISQWIGEPERFDIIVAGTELKTDEGKNKNIIKRIIGLPGDKIIIENGKVYVNGEEIEEDYLNSSDTNGNFNGEVPKEHVFVLGDNRYHSNDSRSDDVGYIPFEDLKGTVYLRIWPLKDFKSF